MKEIIFVAFLLVVILIAFCIRYMRKVKLKEEELNKKNNVLQEEIDNVNGERDLLVGEYKALLDKYDETKKAKDKLYKLAYNDSLTDLPNKIALQEVIDSAFATLRKEEKFVLMHIDLDNFTILNIWIYIIIVFQYSYFLYSVFKKIK